MRFSRSFSAAFAFLALVFCLCFLTAAPAAAQSQDCAGGSCGTTRGYALPGAPLPLPLAIQSPQLQPVAYHQASQSYAQSSYSESTTSYSDTGPSIRRAGLIPRGSGFAFGAVRRVGRFATAPFRLCR